jgi:hypothetical protein
LVNAVPRYNNLANWAPAFAGVELKGDWGGR